MDPICYRYVAEAETESGILLGNLDLIPDFGPAVEAGLLEGIRCGALPAAHGFAGSVTQTPEWDQRVGEPFVGGLRTSFVGDDGGTWSHLVEKQYFRPAAEIAARPLIERGLLRPGERFTFRLCAFPREPVTRSTPSQFDDLAVEPIVKPLNLENRSLAKATKRAGRCGTDVWQETDMAVLMPRSVLDEASRQTREAGDRETGGVLVGRLLRDPRLPDLFAEVTAQIAAEYSEASTTRLTFTPDTWAAVSATVKMRKKDEILLGFWHSHPFFCKNCPEERRQHCRYSRPFFSEHDCAFHRTVFARAFNVALLLTNLGGSDLSVDLFGWRAGVIAPRGFYRLPN